MPDVVICNTSPLLYLYRLRHLEILRQLYHQLVVPEAVRDELHAGRMQGEDTPELEAYAWMTVRTVRVPEVIQLITDLGPGEAQVLVLALEEPGSLVILDDGFARAVATTRGMRLTGGEAGTDRFPPVSVFRVCVHVDTEASRATRNSSTMKQTEVIEVYDEAPCLL